MAVNPEERRQAGISQMTAADMTGSRTKDGRGVNLPETTYQNPGPTANIRGIEANTNWGWESTAEPMIQVSTGGEMPVSSPPFQVPMDAMGDVDGDAPDGWQTHDSSANNSVMPDWPQVGSFTKFGEKYPGFGDPDNDGG